MADEPATAEVTAEEPQTPEQTPVVSPDRAPVVDTPPTPETPAEPDRGDPRIAMQEERKKRQELEARLNDPTFIYETAKRLGMAQDDTPSAAPVPDTTPQQAPGNPDIGQTVDFLLDVRETVKAHPELDPNKGDKGLVLWADSLVRQGHSLSQAADIIFKTMGKHTSTSVQTAVEEKLDARAQSDAQKLSADAISSTVTTSSDAQDLEELNAAAKDWKNPRRQEAAVLEKLKRGMK